MHPLALGVADAVLSPWCERYQLMLTQIIRLMPGQEAQPLHRDRWAFTYKPLPIEPQLNLIWALTDFTEANGATVVAPGSHRWPYERMPEAAETTQAVMRRGSALIYTGTVVHGGGANRSDAPRLGLNINYCLGWLRQEENQYLACPPEVARTLESELAALVGYAQGSYALGYYSRPDGEGSAGILPPEHALGRRSERAASIA
jgi:ectoine hydroxylase-related dioxygenase (phytanoyl-CoA dioxygenase family)